MSVGMQMPGQGDLFDVVRTLGAASCLASGLYRWQQERNQDADDGDDYQELNERECA
jgi:hypothetical protein